MNQILSISQFIKKEAEELLRKYNIIEILAKFGEVRFTGSYELDLMYKKDIDVSLINDNLIVSDFTQLGKELIDNLETPSVYYRNTRIAPANWRPEKALYWGIKAGEWFFDIWAMNKEVYSRADNYIQKIKSKLNSHNKTTILKLKEELIKNKTYGKNFGSRELYDAVLNNAVDSMEKFKAYLEKYSHLNEYR